jgi:membrane protein YdbS with pleckstrin-like domain
MAREQLRAARQAHDGSVRRATPRAGLILAVSIFCGALTISPSHRRPGDIVTIVALVGFVVELFRLSARNHWRALRSSPRPKWNVSEFALIAVAVLVGGLVGPHVLASHSNSTFVSWGLGAAVAVAVAACLFAANASYRHRSSRAWQR